MELWLLILFLSRKKIHATIFWCLAALWNWALMPCYGPISFHMLLCFTILTWIAFFTWLALERSPSSTGRWCCTLQRCRTCRASRQQYAKYQRLKKENFEIKHWPPSLIKKTMETYTRANRWTRISANHSPCMFHNQRWRPLINIELKEITKIQLKITLLYNKTDTNTTNEIKQQQNKEIKQWESINTITPQDKTTHISG